METLIQKMKTNHVNFIGIPLHSISHHMFNKIKATYESYEPKKSPLGADLTAVIHPTSIEKLDFVEKVQSELVAQLKTLG